MLFIDASALTAIITDEPQSKFLSDRIEAERDRCTSGIALWEAALAVARIKAIDAEAGWSEVDRYRAALAIVVVPIAATEAQGALAVHGRYGKGTGHPARLNMGDCFAYACARTNGARLLYKGDDFARTDLA